MAAPALALFLGACASAPATEPSTIITRPLTPVEKTALRASLVRTMKDPDAAQFKWMPAVVAKTDIPMDRPIGYCGLINGKNSYGGYVGFKRFYATLTRNPKGEYVTGTIEHIEGAPITFGGTSTVDDAVETGLVEGSCKAWGYTDFTAAN